MRRAIIPISVIIPTLNRHNTLIQTVRSLCSGTSIPKQIVIIDQSSVPIEVVEFRGLHGTEIEIMHPAIASSTYARNEGIKAATEEVLLFCDDDILINEETLEKLFVRISDSGVALVSAIHYRDNAVFEGPKKHDMLRDLGGTLLGMKKFWRKDGYVVKSNMRGRYASGISTVVNTEWAMGYFFCIKRSILKNLDHYFDEHLIRYAYAEDLDFTYRYCVEAGKVGLRTVVDPTLYVNHLASREWRVPKQEEVNYIFANRRYLSWKLFPSKRHYRIAMWWFDHLYLLTQLRKREYASEIRSSLKLCSDKKEIIKSGAIAEIS